MAATGIGMDLLEIERLEQVLSRHPRLADQVFTEGERRYAADRRRPGRHLAGRFAAKEAVVKALGLRHAFAIEEIEIIAGEPPTVLLSGRAALAAVQSGVEVAISITHSRQQAGAVAITQPTGAGRRTAPGQSAG